MRRLLSIVVLCFAALSLSAATDSLSAAAPSIDASSAVDAAQLDAAAGPLRPDKAVADSLYTARDYAEAVRHYAALADSLPSSDVYYNLGNAHYRQKNYAQAVLAYERALRLNPDNDDAQFNITLVRTRLADSFGKSSEMFFVSWIRAWVKSHSVMHWTAFSLLWLVVFFVCLAVYLVGSRLSLRKVGFFGAIFAVLCFLLTTTFAIVQRYNFYNNTDAVILASELQLYASPSASSKQVRTIHEGTTVTIIDSEGKSWHQVVLPDGTEAWMPAKGFELVN